MSSGRALAEGECTASGCKAGRQTEELKAQIGDLWGLSINSSEMGPESLNFPNTPREN